MDAVSDSSSPAQISFHTQVSQLRNQAVDLYQKLNSEIEKAPWDCDGGTLLTKDLEPLFKEAVQLRSDYHKYAKPEADEPLLKTLQRMGLRATIKYLHSPIHNLVSYIHWLKNPANYSTLWLVRGREILRSKQPWTYHHDQ